MYWCRILKNILSKLSEKSPVPVWVHIQPIFTPFNITLDRIQSSKDPSSSVQTLSFSLYLCTHLQRSTSSKKTHVYPGKIDACMLMCVPSRQELPLKPSLFQTAHTLHIKVLNFWRGRDIRAITYFVRPQYTCFYTSEGGLEKFTEKIFVITVSSHDRSRGRWVRKTPPREAENTLISKFSPRTCSIAVGNILSSFASPWYGS